MIIKESKDVAIMLIERYDAIQKLGPNMRMWIVDQIMELYHEVREAEGCRVECGMWCTTDERKELLKTEIKEHIREAEYLAAFIDGELNREMKREESVTKGYLDFDVLSEINTVEEQKQYIDDVMPNKG